MKNEKGVTLIEVMSTLIILSVLSGIATPIFQNMLLRMDFNQEVSLLVSKLHEARSVAMKGNSRVVFCYSASGYKIFVDDGAGGGTEEDWKHQSGEQLLADITLGDRFQIVLDDSTFTLQRTRFSGRPGITAGSIVMQGHDGRKTKIVLNVIGRVRVEKV